MLNIVYVISFFHRFTQPETLLAIVAVILIYFASHLDSESYSDVLLRFIHLTSFATYVGMSFWMTFVAGKFFLLCN